MPDLKTCSVFILKAEVIIWPSSFLCTAKDNKGWQKDTCQSILTHKLVLKSLMTLITANHHCQISVILQNDYSPIYGRDPHAHVALVLLELSTV